MRRKVGKWRFGPYGEMTRRAAARLLAGTAAGSLDAWEGVGLEVFPGNDGRPAREKAQPRAAFLRLCELVLHVPAAGGPPSAGGDWVARFLDLLRDRPGWADLPPLGVWRKARAEIPGLPEVHGGQMAVVLAFWHDVMR